MMELNRQRLNVHSSNILKNKIGLDELNQIAMLQHGLKWAEREKGESGQSRQIRKICGGGSFFVFWIGFDCFL